MIEFQLDETSGVATYLQLVQQVHQALRMGMLEPGDRDNDDGTGWHVDRPQDQLPETVIPVLGLGAPRRFLIRPEGGGARTTIVAHGGDLVVMGGRCQKDYQHSVPKQNAARRRPPEPELLDRRPSLITRTVRPERQNLPNLLMIAKDLVCAN